jgi:transposase
MSKPYSSDLRERVVAAVEKEGMSRNAAAARFGVAVSTAVHWVNRYRTTGSVKPGKIGGHVKPKIRDGHADWLRARCLEKDFILKQLVEELETERQLKVDLRTVWNFVHSEGLSFKKKSVRKGAGSARRGAPARAVAALPGKSCP